MSNLVFPRLPGISIERSRSPYWDSKVQRSVSGKSVGFTAYTYPLWRYKLKFEFLRSGAQTELQQVVGLFNRVYGQADTFLFLDDDDSVATDQVIGYGDGATRSFRLTRAYGDFIEPLAKAKQIDSVKVAGSTVTSYTEADGVLTFAAPPSAGQEIKWSGIFYFRCRFKNDSIDFDRFLWELWKAGSVEFTTEKI